MTLARPSLIAGAVLILVAPAAAHGLQEEVEEIAALFDLEEGMRLADVGAGEGEFGEALAYLVGPKGHVFIQEIDDGELKKIRKLIEESGQFNMTAVEGDSGDARLPEDCCDGVLLRDVYHHLSRPGAMLDSLKRALRPHGRLVIIEHLEDGHGTSLEDVIDEVTAAGFQLLSQQTEWGGHEAYHATVFALTPRSGRAAPPRPSAR